MYKLYFYETEPCCFKSEPKKALFSLILIYSAMTVCFQTTHSWAEIALFYNVCRELQQSRDS